MGIDISIRTDIDEKVYSPDYWNPELDNFQNHSLSRAFCNLMCRKDVVEGEPELDQIGRITSIDISVFYEMESYGDDETLKFHLARAKDKQEREEIINQAAIQRARLNGNLAKVLHTIDDLISKLSVLDQLQNILNNNDYDTLDHNRYFTDFNEDKGEGYIGNNLGQDLRNFKRFLEYAKSKGAKTVYFRYG